MFSSCLSRWTDRLSSDRSFTVVGKRILARWKRFRLCLVHIVVQFKKRFIKGSECRNVTLFGGFIVVETLCGGFIFVETSASLELNKTQLLISSPRTSSFCLATRADLQRMKLCRWSNDAISQTKKTVKALCFRDDSDRNLSSHDQPLPRVRLQKMNHLG